MTFGWGPMGIFVVFAIYMCASAEVGGSEGGHGKVELLFGAVHVLCRNTPLWWDTIRTCPIDARSISILAVWNTTPW